MGKVQKRKSKVYPLSQRKAGVFFIGRKRYDLGAATLLCEHHNNGFYGTGLHAMENLFVTDLGAFVLYGAGESQTKYAHQLPNGNWIHGTKVSILTADEAYDYLEGHNKLDDVIVQKYFADIVTDG